MDVIKQLSISVWNFLKLALAEKLHRRKERLGRSYTLKDRGEFRIFRETTSGDVVSDKHVVLVVGFRLKLLGNNKLAHKLFQKVCILTTPFWSGFVGFATKLWMVQPQTNNYLGIYDWSGKQNAQNYADTLVKILRPLSTPDSVWYKIHETEFEKYLEEREYRLP